MPTRGEWLDVPPLRRPVLREIPEPEGEGWHDRAVALWEAWRHDPVSQLWSPADVAAAAELIYLFEAFLRKDQRILPAELRQREDRLGLGAKGRRDLRWRIAEEEVGEDELAAKRGRRERVRFTDPRG